MKQILKKYFMVTTAVFVLSEIIPSFQIAGSYNNLFYATFILSLLFYIAKPIINLIMLPINILTLNLAAWLVNILIIYFWTIFVPEVKIQSWQFSGLQLGVISLYPFNFAAWQVIIIISISLTIIIQFLEWLLR